MVYSHPHNEIFNALDVTPTPRPTPAVQVKYNNSGIHQFTGPVPLVDINHTVSRNNAGLIEGHIVRIDLSGKIIMPTVTINSTGIGPVLTGIKNLREFLAKNDNGTLEVVCGSTNTIVSFTGAKLADFTVNKSDDNWTQSADYSMSFECYQPSGIAAGYYVKSTNDSWSIESLEDSVYTNISLNSNIKSEVHNPQLKPNAPSDSSVIPGPVTGPGSSPSNASVTAINVPQYRITHRVSAVGLPSGTGNLLANGSYMEAKRWVTDRLATSFNTSAPNWSSGIGYFMESNDLNNYNTNKLFLYNHVRSTNFSITDGSYEINDTWLAMPSGVAYIEDYSIEASTDDRNIKTVRVQGQIRGLNLTNLSVLSGDPNYINPSGSGKILLKDYDQQIASDIGHNILDNNTQTSSTKIQQYKYQNALSGWLYDIKPYVYRRAGILINSPDRNATYTSPTNPTTRPNNPIYCYEGLLNPNPTSTTEGHDPRKGTISYSVEYNNRLNIISGVLSENISINHSGPTDVFGETFVIGRRLGPVLQSLNARTSARKDVTIDVTVPPPTSVAQMLINNSACPVYTGGYIYTTIDDLIKGLAPWGPRTQSLFGNTRAIGAGNVFLTQNNHSWNPADGRFSRSVSWTYQPCTNSQNYLDS